MAFQNRTALLGSEKHPLPGSVPVGSIDPNEKIRVAVFLRRKGADPVAHESGQRLTHDELREQHGADPADIALVEGFATEYHLAVVESSVSKRRVTLTGTAAQMATAFGTELRCYRIEATGHDFRGRTGAISIPEELAGVVVAVLGLDSRPVAKPHFRVKPAATSGSFTPPQIAKLYNFPGGLNGAGQTVAIVELGGGFVAADLQTYFKSLGITMPNVTAVSVDGGANTPGTDADGEVMLDIEVCGAIAPAAKIAVYFAPNTDQGFIDAITDAVHDTARKPSVVSISWGGPEDQWTQQSRRAMNAALQDAASLGVTVTAAAGDNGSSDGVNDKKLHVDFPASSPFALACGGTTLKASGTSISSETVWNEIQNNEGATGGGVSAVFPIPSYQKSAGVPVQPQTKFAGRGVPDISGDADPATGYQVRVNGQNTVVGGTSAVAPLWAALAALMNQKLGKPVGFLNPKLYTLGASVFRDISSGNNDDSGLGFYKAKAGWDACTGLGSPNGTAILNALGKGSTTSANGTAAPRIQIPGSEPKHLTVDNWTEIENPASVICRATLVLHPADSGDTAAKLLSGQATGSRDNPAGPLGADSAEIEKVDAFANANGLKVVSQNAAKRTVRVEGTVQQMNAAFGIALARVTNSHGEEYMTYKGPITVPADLEGVVIAVLGLDERPIAKAHGS